MAGSNRGYFKGLVGVADGSDYTVEVRVCEGCGGRSEGGSRGVVIKEAVGVRGDNLEEGWHRESSGREECKVHFVGCCDGVEQGLEELQDKEGASGGGEEEMEG